MFHWGWKFPHLRQVSAADCRCCCADEHWTYRQRERKLFKAHKRQRTLHNTRMLVYSRILFPHVGARESFLGEQCEKWSSRKFPSHFTAEKFRSHAGMWNVSSGKTWARQTQRLFWQGRKLLTCQSRHSSVNSCLILCWKLVLAWSRGRQKVKGEANDNPSTPQPPAARTLCHRWSAVGPRGKNLIVCCETRHRSFNIKAVALLVTAILMRVSACYQLLQMA